MRPPTYVSAKGFHTSVTDVSLVKFTVGHCHEFNQVVLEGLYEPRLGKMQPEQQCFVPKPAASVHVCEGLHEQLHYALQGAMLALAARFGAV